MVRYRPRPARRGFRLGFEPSTTRQEIADDRAESIQNGRPAQAGCPFRHGGPTNAQTQMHDFVVGLVDMMYKVPFFAGMLALGVLIFFLRWAFAGGASDEEE